jgi:hypothetical protein
MATKNDDIIELLEGNYLKLPLVANQHLYFNTVGNKTEEIIISTQNTINVYIQSVKTSTLNGNQLEWEFPTLNKNEVNLLCTGTFKATQLILSTSTIDQ